MKSLVAPIICAVVYAVVFSCAQAEEISIENRERLTRQEKSGLRHYERGNYAEAFESLSATAVRGMKRSQFYLAYMFFKGQHVEQSVLLGMGWLGVAIESGEPEWIELYQSLYQRIPPEQHALIDAKVAQYVEKYGMVTQHVSCSRRPAAGSRRIESLCVKAIDKSYPIHPVETRPNQGAP
ncbi:MAG: hypothetical protein OEW68_10480 [Gammaproteobacteria bacterium]|nr:hypothetical protein [Gammaproteobacteria bacterium]MDH4315254.1 hypothetical protein [Gammaproteobacteria bacterium]MDH5215531.1 hypothetical protein [Gammaproteobacteria bacterium]